MHTVPYRRIMKSTITHFRSESGFSLVEVVISIGVVSFGLLSVFGLLPLGLTTFQNSMEIYYSGQTRQEVLNSLQQTDMSALLSNATSYSETDYFDAEGTFIAKQTPTSTPTFSSTPVYQVAVKVSTLTPASVAITLPNAGGVPPTAATLANAVSVTTQFSRYKGTAGSASAGATTYRTGTDYLYYNK